MGTQIFSPNFQKPKKINESYMFYRLLIVEKL